MPVDTLTLRAADRLGIPLCQVTRQQRNEQKALDFVQNYSAGVTTLGGSQLQGVNTITTITTRLPMTKQQAKAALHALLYRADDITVARRCGQYPAPPMSELCVVAYGVWPLPPGSYD